MKRTSFLLPLFVSLTLLVGACGSGGIDGAPVANGGGSSVDCPDAEGDVIVSGSSTVEPISASVGELLEDCGSGVLATVDGPGTGDGFQLFCAGETDISDASRPIKEEEASDCAANDVEFIELKVAIDGIAVMTNPDNPVECLSLADLYALIGPEAEGFTRWRDAQGLAAELGSSTELPDVPLDIIGPGEESGTYDSFMEIVMGEISEARAEAGKITEDEIETARKDYSSQVDDNAIIAGIGGSPSSLGWVGFAFAEEAGRSVAEIAVSAEPNGECVVPTPETIASTEYPIARNLYIYVNAQRAEENPAVAAYVDFYLSDEGIESVSAVGYVSLTNAALGATRDVWEARETGSRDD